MQFAQPNLLYALFLLVIPIIIHLFQLRRYTPIAFTNVAMLQRIEKQSRKSHSILQWLLLLLRLLMFTCIILAFAQPFFPKKNDTAINNQEVLLYIDNSMSMDAKINTSNLLQYLQSEIQELEQLPSQISWFTNTDVYYDQSPKIFLNTIGNLDLSPITRSANEIRLLSQQLANRKPNKNYKLIWASDFHRFTEEDLTDFDKIEVEAYAIQPNHSQNTRIDTLYMDVEHTNLVVELYHQGEKTETMLSLYDGEKSIGRQKIALQDSITEKVQFNIATDSITQGRLKIEDTEISFDNEKFFSLLPQDPIKIKAIGKGDVDYLKVFESSEFQLEIIEETTMDFSGLEDSNLIVIYNIERLSTQLANLLEASLEKGTSILIIPSESIQIENYNDFLQRIDAPQFTIKKDHSRRLSTIHFDHPVLQNVFERRIDNFQNPFIHQHYGLQNNAFPILSYDSGEAFLTQAGKLYLFSAALNEKNTNFMKSPLIVPTFHNIALQSQPQKQLYQLLGQPITYAVSGAFKNQDILHITNKKNSFIPIQEQKQNSIWISTSDRPLTAGNYRITKEEKIIDWVSYNYPNLDKNIYYPELVNWQSINQIQSLSFSDTTQSLNAESHTLWKWFVIFALLFLGIEILLLKIYR